MYILQNIPRFQLADEMKLREDLEAELELKDQELSKLHDVEQRRREAEEEVER